MKYIKSKSTNIKYLPSYHFLWPILLMVIIFVESSIPMDGGPNNIAFLTNLKPGIQNLLHIPLYGILFFLWLKVFTTPKRSIRQIVLCSLMITISYCCIDEVHQSFVKGRCGGFLDISLNMVGAIFGTVLFLKPWGDFKKRLHNILISK